MSDVPKNRVRRVKLGFTLLIALVVLGLGVVLVFVLVGQHGKSDTGGRGGGQAPQQAVQIAHDVVSDDAQRARAALSPGLQQLLASGDTVAPVGTTLALEAGSWRQDGYYASATGVLTEPGQPGAHLLVGFVLVDGRWYITAMERLP